MEVTKGIGLNTATCSHTTLRPQNCTASVSTYGKDGLHLPQGVRPPLWEKTNDNNKLLRSEVKGMYYLLQGKKTTQLRFERPRCCSCYCISSLNLVLTNADSTILSSKRSGCMDNVNSLTVKKIFLKVY